MTPGPPPKDALSRRRRSTPAGGDWIDLPPLDKPVLPALGKRSKADGGPWSQRARDTWNAWRQDPATTQWSPSDRAYALDTLHLVDECARQIRSSVAAEIRLRMDGLGLTAKGKRNLRWRVAPPGELIDLDEHRDARAGRRRRVRAVDPDDGRTNDDQV